MSKRNASRPVEFIVADLPFSERARRAIACDAHVRAAAEYIVSHIADPFMLDQIATNLNLNRCYLSRMFSKKTGICLSKFARRIKIAVASQSLSEDLGNVSAVAVNVGFRNVSTFRRNFKLLTDSSPSAYRGARYRTGERAPSRDPLLLTALKERLLR